MSCWVIDSHNTIYVLQMSYGIAKNIGYHQEPDSKAIIAEHIYMHMGK